MLHPPTDPDSDYFVEDLNAKGRKDFSDIQVFFANMVWIAGNEPIDAFDYNKNARIDFSDIQVLYLELGDSYHVVIMIHP